VEGSEVATKDLEGAASKTYNVALAVFPVPPFVEETLPVVLTYVPEEGAATLAVIVQLPLAAIDPPLSVITLPPEVPVIVPLHWGVATFAANVTPVGKVSVKATPVNAMVVFELVIVKVSVDVPPAKIGLGEKDLPMEGGAMTVVVSLAVLPVPPFVEVTAPVVLFFTPAVEPVTVTLNVQLPLAAIEPPLNAIVSGAVVVNVPPHWVVEEAATVKPAGRVSVTATPVKAVPAFGFVIVKLNVVVPFNRMVAAPNDLLIEGGATTVTVSDAVLFVSSSSVIFPFGSTVAVFARLPAEVGVTATVTLNDAPAGNVTVPPLATQLRAVPVIEQPIVPVGGVAPFVTVNAPCG